MHQTFYIDVDEEVNSVIGRIRKSNAKYNILVVAQGALLMQSSVSLKLIKKESDILDKKVMIVTKDDRAAIIAKKIGFPVRRSLDEVKEISANPVLKKPDIQIGREAVNENKVNAKPDSDEISNKRNRLTNLGADSFIATNGIIKKNNLVENNRSSFLKNNLDDSNREKVVVKNNNLLESQNDGFKDLFTEFPEPIVTEKKQKTSNKNMLKFLWFFVAIIMLLILGIAAYFFLPSAEISVFPLKRDENISLKLNISEDDNVVDPQGNTINLRGKIIEDEGILSLTFDATGQKGGSDQKAKGTITIYNEFSETSQVLVATTRLLSDNDKLFRLLNTVTVPGMTIVDGKVEPGKIEAEIIADESGTDFNIKEATLAIPGFKGSAKYDKFYAKLTQETKGGGSSGGDLKMVSRSDIESAKFKTENQLKNQLKDSIKNKSGEENILLDNALIYEVTDFSVFPEESSVTESFEYQVKIKVKSIVFSSGDLDEKITTFINSSVIKKEVPLKLISFSKNYGNADINFAKGTINMEINVNAKLRSQIDADKISNSLAGKSRDEMSGIISNYPQISKAEAIISPSFISNSFPKYPSKIKVIISDN
ncbi:MAG: hypothetical protein WC682_00600 [Parcubacteria group bacterium]|jgi:hypothetical protein